MTVTIEDVTIDVIIDFNSEEANNVAVPNWLNEDPDIDANVWSKTRERLI